jgi:hypothetical protein
MEPTSALPATAPTVKKNDLESPVPGDTPPPTVVAELRNPIPFEFGKESEIWSQVISSLTDMTRSHARNVSRAAISGPNQLVLTIPKSYHLSKQYFERSPDQLGKLEAAVESAVGRRIALRFEVDDSSPATESTAEPRPGRPEFEKKISEASRDPLVQKAIAAFGATIVRVEQGIGG